MQTLYLIEAKAQNPYPCSTCNRLISRGSLYFRHDPHPFARMKRGQKIEHYCYSCVMATDPGPKDSITKRFHMPAELLNAKPMKQDVVEENLFATKEKSLVSPRIEIVSVGRLLTERLSADPMLIHQLTPDEFEEFVCDRLFAMGLEPKRVGSINQKDGGIDIMFWPRLPGAFPFLGAAQVKHHHNKNTKEGSSTVRNFSGALNGQRFNAGIIVTNTSFSADAEWYVRNHATLIRLRSFDDIRRWISNDFEDQGEWREIPRTIELCPGTVIKIRD